jgi:hypothetical protein
MNMAQTKSLGPKDHAYAEKVAGWMWEHSETYRLVRDTADRKMAGSGSLAVRRAALAIHVYAMREAAYIPPVLDARLAVATVKP